MSVHLRIATRSSDLAIYQSNWVGKKLVSVSSGLTYELVKVSSPPINHKDSFVKLCEDAILNKDADIAVHSAKDLPLGTREGLVIGAVCERENPLDVLLLGPGVSIEEDELLVGTSSPRRKVQARGFAANIRIEELRGNLPTRINSLKGEGEGKFSAIILAAAGLIRLGLTEKISRYFTPQEMVPAAGQGAILVQLSSTDERNNSLARKINHPRSENCILAERHCCYLLGADCDSAIGAYSFISDGTMFIYAMVGDIKTNQRLLTCQQINPVEHGISDWSEAAWVCAELAAKDLIEKGAEKFNYKKVKS